MSWSERVAGLRPDNGYAAAALLAGALSAFVATAAARPVDPTLPVSLAMDRVTLSRRSLGEGVLPRSANVVFRLRVATAVAHPPTVTRDRTVLLAHSDPVLAEYDGRGRTLWAARLGPTAAASSPFVFADGTRAVITEGGDLLGFSRRGRPLSHTRLPFGTIGQGLVIEPTLDGGLLLAEGQRLVRLDATGTLIADSQIGVEVRALLSAVERGRTGPLIVSAAGSVLELSPDGRPSFRSRFSGPVTAAVRLDDQRLLAVVDEHRLVELDLADDSERVRAETPDLELSPLLALNSAGESRVLASGDFLLAHDARGEERFRVSLSQPGAGANSGASPELLLDPAGTALVVGPGFGTVAVAADGQSTRIEGSACPEPLRPASLPPSSVIVACRSGILLRLDAPDDARRATPSAAPSTGTPR